MASLHTDASPGATKPSEIWFTRCPVPTATGLAYQLGWFDETFAADGVPVQTLQETPELGRHHYDHRLPTLIREGGSMLAIAARAQGEQTRLVGLTWIEEAQVILVRPDSGIRTAADLRGKRVALPGWTDHEIPSHLRGCSISRGMSLLGLRGALASAGLTFDDVTVVEIPSAPRGESGGRRDSLAGRSGNLGRLWPIDALVDGHVDAVYVKGASALDAAKAHGVIVGIDLDRLENPRFRVNNGTPRPITVHQDLIDNHFDYLVRFLATTLRAADWATANPDHLRSIAQTETLGSPQAVINAYGEEFHLHLHPDLSESRLSLLEQQKKALLLHGFLDRDFDLDKWVDPRPLEAARALLETEKSRGFGAP